MQTSLYQTLSQPLGLPELKQLFFPEDRIVLLPDTFYAAEYEVLLEIVSIFTAHQAAPQQLTLLLTDADEPLAAAKLFPRLPAGVQLQFHQPGNASALARLGVNDKDEPILLNRTLIDADLILTIGRFADTPAKNHFGIHSAVFPRFSDTATVQRFQTSKASKKKLADEAGQVAALLGILFTVQFLPRKGHPPEFAAGLPLLVAETFNRRH